MPNYCDNTLRVTGLTKQEAEYLAALAERRHPLGFLETLVPVPKGLEDSWDWYIENWGTKWDIDEATASVNPSGDTYSLYLSFDSAWSPPDTAIVAISKLYPHAKFLLYYSEPGCDFAGRLECQNGVTINAVDTEYSTLKELWLKNEYPDLYIPYTADEEEAVEEVEDLWGDVCYDIIQEYLDVLANKA